MHSFMNETEYPSYGGLGVCQEANEQQLVVYVEVSTGSGRIV